MKRTLLIAGAGKSAPVLIDYLLNEAAQRDWEVVVGDLSLETAQQAVGGHPNGRAITFDATDDNRRAEWVKQSDIVISLLPPLLHLELAEDCVQYRKHFVSASYVPDEMRKLDGPAERVGVTLLNEMGVDPGIDHMSAMEKLDAIRAAGHTITAFETFTGGLVAPECDDNPWSYKLTWNPRNVVLAGQGGVKFKHNGRYKYIPYHKLFSRYETVSGARLRRLRGLPQPRLPLLPLALRPVGRGHDLPRHAAAARLLQRLGLPGPAGAHRRLLRVRRSRGADLPRLRQRLPLVRSARSPWSSSCGRTSRWISTRPRSTSSRGWGSFDRDPIGLTRATPAQILQKRLEERWALDPNDRDMVVMVHRVVYEAEGKHWREQSSMVAIGEDARRTAMAKTVGLPVGIGAKLLLEGGITRRGVVIPTAQDVYAPLLKELRQHGIAFTEEKEQQDSPHVP